MRPFEADSFVEGSLYQDFLTSAGIDIRAADLEPVQPRNESMDAESVEFLRLLNLCLVEQDGAKPGLIPHRPLGLLLAERSTGPTLTLPDAGLDAFMAQWEAPNRAVARDFLPDGRAELFRAPRRARETTAVQRLDPARLDHFVAIADVPERLHEPLRRIAEREALSG